MKYPLIIVFFVLLSFSYLDVSAQPQPTEAYRESSQLIRDLSGHHWKMKKMYPGQGIKAGIPQLPPEDIETLVWNPASVPGDVYTDLWKAGVIDDPYFGRNSAKAQWVMYDEWWYVTQFNVTDDLTDKVIRLHFDGVDYSCEVWLNGIHLGSHQGAFSPFSFDITEAIRSAQDRLQSQNILVIKLDPPPQVNNQVVGSKTPWFGDYWRDLVPFGIWRPIRIEATGAVRIDDLYVHSDLNENASANVNLELTLENTGSTTREVTISASLQGYNFTSDPIAVQITETVAPGLHTIKKTVAIDNPKLWWPWDLGDPNLYQAQVTVHEGDAFQDKTETTFGIREIEMEWNPGFTKDEVSFPRTIMLNGKNHFIRSACWGGPPDIFVGRTSVEEYKELIRLAKEANMNNIRIFGWHPPEIPEFYQMCNEAGLTVWQDVIPLGTGNMPRDQEFLDGVIAEGVAVIKERRNHPCLILIEGGEEMFLRASDPEFTNNFLLRLGDSLQQYVDLPYVPDSPLTSETALSVGYKPKEAVHALMYFYGMGHALMEDWYGSLDYPIVPELAITSVPSVESLKKFIPQEEMWPPGLSWGHHWADLDRLRIQNFDAFGDERTGSLEEFVNATQDAQGIIFQLSVEHFRRRKPRTSGISLCHFITYWPDMKWGIIDNYQQPKRSYYFVQRAYQPLLISLQFDKRRWKNNEPFQGEIWIINDLYQSYQGGQVKLRIVDNDGNPLAEETFRVEEIAENSSVKLTDISQDVLAKVDQSFRIELELVGEDGEQLSTNEYLLLIGDQEQASAQFKEMGREINQTIGKYTYGNYYRFFPELNGEQGWDSETDTPRAKGFEQ
ncbi:MAG: glycoside hydrolase family 2 protein [Cyclobacteriaceae bacterium]